MKKIILIIFTIHLWFSGGLFAQFTVASDDATNYSGTWGNADNYGSGFAAWSITYGTSTGTFIGNPSTNGMGTTGIGTTAFGLWSTSTGYVNASRGIISGMQFGDSFSFYWAMNWDANTGAKGFDFKSSSSTIFNINNGGSATITSTNGTADASYGTDPMLVTLTRTSGSEYSFSMTRRSDGSTYSTTISNSNSIDELHIYLGNQTDGSGERNIYFNNFEISNSGDFNIASGSETYSKVLSGSNNLTKSGAGTLVLSADNTYTGTTTVSAGTLQLEGNLSDSDVTVEDGGTLKINGSDVTIKSLTVDAGGTVEIEPNMGLTVTGTASNSGTFTIKSDATGTGSFILETTGFTANFQQYIDNNNEYHFISVPFKATMPEICDGNWAPLTTAFDQAVGETYDFYYLDESVSGNYWINLKNDSWGVNTSDFGNPPRFVKGKGYLVAYSSSFSGSDTKSSSGTLQNGNLIYDGLTASSLTYNLIGNPFPSSLDWKGSGWGRSNLEDDSGYNLWIWNGSSGQFGTYNSGSGSDDGTHGTSRYIAPAQGFYVQAASAGNLTFPAASRTHSTKTLLKNTNSNKQLRLFVTGDANHYSDEIIIEFGHSDNTGGSPKLASLYSTAPSLSTIKEGTNFSIDFRTNEINQNIIPVSFEPGVNGTYTISGSDFNFESVLLKDKKTSEIIDLKLVGSYSFVSVVEDDSDRFEILFSPVGIDEQVTVSDIKVFANNGNITILNNNTLTGSINIVNILGQSVFTGSLNGNTKQNIRLNQEFGVYIINIKTVSGSFISQKVIIN